MQRTESSQRKIFVGNLPHNLTENELLQIFEQVGPVRSVYIPLNRETNTPRGFGFVEMRNSTDLSKALIELNGYVSYGRPLAISEAHERPAAPEKRY